MHRRVASADVTQPIGPRRARLPHGDVIRVLLDGPAAVAGLRAGDRVLAVNGLVPRDIIDVRLDATSEHVELDVERNGERIVIAVDKRVDEDLGVEFASAAFDRMKTCNNRCAFCFIGGLPPGLRRSLYIKDDDFRYSFLYGNFTTLTNLSEHEWQRIIFQRLSPLRVSVHATDLDLRREILGNPHAPDILAQIDELAPHDIRIHAQIVLMPDKNDGEHLQRTISDLMARYPTVESAAVVPVGFTTHNQPATMRAVEASDADSAIRIVESAQRRCRRALGVGFAYASDELYLLAGRRLPAHRSYDGYPQYHNGVGLIQSFRTDWRRVARRRPASVDPARSVGWATGPLLAPILEEMAADLAPVRGLRVDVFPISSSLFGGSVTVAGLLSGADVVAQLAARPFDRLVLSRSMFDAAGERTIDGWTARDIGARIDREVVVASGASGLLEATLGAPASVRMQVTNPRDEINADGVGDGDAVCAAS